MNPFALIDQMARSHLGRLGYRVELRSSEGQHTDWIAYPPDDPSKPVSAPTLGELLKRCVAREQKRKNADNARRGEVRVMAIAARGGRS